MAEAKCPVHVNDVDLFAPGAQAHWFDAYRILHQDAPVHRLPGEGDHPGTDAYILTRYEDISRVVRDPDSFPIRYEQGVGNAEAEVIREHGFEDSLQSRATLRPDIDSHKMHRHQLTDPWVGTGAERHRAMITAATHRLIDGFIDRGTIEYVAEFAAPLPTTVIMTILGFPLEDMQAVRRWDAAQVRRFVYGEGHLNIMSDEDERENARTLVEFHEYIGRQIDEKRAHPRDDMISFLTQVQYGDGEAARPLTDGEITSVAYGMNIGGNETTQYALTAQAMLLAEHPQLVEELRADRAKIKAFVEESLRLYAPTQGLSTRRVARDVEFQGVTVPKGSILHLRYGAGNRDEQEFADAERFDLNRHKPARHLTFSQGPRSCPGSGLSRLEQAIATEAIIDRLDELAFAPGKNTFERQPGIMLGLWELHLTFKAR